MVIAFKPKLQSNEIILLFHNCIYIPVRMPVN